MTGDAYIVRTNLSAIPDANAANRPDENALASAGRLPRMLALPTEVPVGFAPLMPRSKGADDLHP